MEETEKTNVVERLLNRLLDFAGKSVLNAVLLLLIIAVVLFSSCWLLTAPAISAGTGETEAVEVTVIVEETVIVYRTVEVTRLVPVEVTSTPSPSPEAPVNTPTPSAIPNTPTETPTITPTPSYTPTATHNIALTQTRDALGNTADAKTDGTYQVGTEISVGLWESAGTGTECFWKRMDGAGNTIDSFYGLAGGSINIQSSDVSVSFEDCGVFIYVQNAEKVLAADAADAKGDGFYTVGVEITPGLWRSTGSGDDCYWARLTETQDVIDSYRGDAGEDLRIEPNDYEVLLDGCGSWIFIEED